MSILIFHINANSCFCPLPNSKFKFEVKFGLEIKILANWMVDVGQILENLRLIVVYIVAAASGENYFFDKNRASAKINYLIVVSSSFFYF